MSRKSIFRIAYLCHLVSLLVAAAFFWQLAVNGVEIYMMAPIFFIPFGVALMTAIFLSLELRSRPLLVLNLLAISCAVLTLLFPLSTGRDALWYALHLVYVYLAGAPAVILYGWREWL